MGLFVSSCSLTCGILVNDSDSRVSNAFNVRCFSFTPRTAIRAIHPIWTENQTSGTCLSFAQSEVRPSFFRYVSVYLRAVSRVHMVLYHCRARRYSISVISTRGENDGSSPITFKSERYSAVLPPPVFLVNLLVILSLRAAMMFIPYAAFAISSAVSSARVLSTLLVPYQELCRRVSALLPAR